MRFDIVEWDVRIGGTAEAGVCEHTVFKGVPSRVPGIVFASLSSRSEDEASIAYAMVTEGPWGPSWAGQGEQCFGGVKEGQQRACLDVMNSRWWDKQTLHRHHIATSHCSIIYHRLHPLFYAKKRRALAPDASLDWFRESGTRS